MQFNSLGNYITMENYDDIVLSDRNPNHPDNFTDEQIEEMTELQYAEYDRNKYQKEAHVLKTKLLAIKAMAQSMSEEIGWRKMILDLIEK